MEHATIVRLRTSSCHCRSLPLDVALTRRSPWAECKRPPSFDPSSHNMVFPFLAKNCRNCGNIIGKGV